MSVEEQAKPKAVRPDQWDDRMDALLAMPLQARAHYVARDAHTCIDQRRKWTGEPYIIHPMTVAYLVDLAGGSDVAKAVAYLHDVVEDTGTTEAQLRALFPEPHVVTAVLELTDPPAMKGGDNREARFSSKLERLKGACPEARMVKLADILDNLPSIVEHEAGFGLLCCDEAEAMLPILATGSQSLHRQLSGMLSLARVASERGAQLKRANKRLSAIGSEVDRHRDPTFGRQK